MQYLGIPYEAKNLPALDPGFIPFGVWAESYLKHASKPIGGHLESCRIGFDAGGSDRKVSAVIDGEAVYSEKVVWHPKKSPDPNYQYEGILDSIRTAASKIPRVDGICVSSAGVFIGNAPIFSTASPESAGTRSRPCFTVLPLPSVMCPS